MTTVFSALPMSTGGRFLRKPDFFNFSKDISTDVAVYFDPDAPAFVDTQDAEINELNTYLRVLIEVFPDVQPEVFRELLLNLSKESRLEVVMENMLRDREKFVQGRYRKLLKKKPKTERKLGTGTSRQLVADGNEGVLPRQETFRSQVYKDAVKLAFYQEFKSLSHSTIKAVLAEQNHSYFSARPTLQQLASRTWRFSLSSLWTKKRTDSVDTTSHPLIRWQAGLSSTGRMLPYLKSTQSSELNGELYAVLIAPVLAQHREEQKQRDLVLAVQMNETEAEEVGAMYECQCCYTTYAFDDIATCDDLCHFVCLRCVRLAIREALYGQGWARNIDPRKSSLRCLAPTNEDCQGCIPIFMLERALMTEKDGAQAWLRLEERIATDCLTKSMLPLLRCPFCPYAELDEVPPIKFRDPVAFSAYVCHMSVGAPFAFLFSMWALLCSILYWLLYSITYLFLDMFPTPASMSAHLPTHHFTASHVRIIRRRRGLKFTCRSVTCGRISCTACQAQWTDPHKCHEESLLSLRHAIEAATTSSIKRTCPKCYLSFVKSSGCNKLVCNCGYTMCYVCRSEIGREGYSHFCQHFRERGGRCAECDRCDLYLVEDEEGVIKRAAESAEREWLERQGTQAIDLLASDHVRTGRPDQVGKVVQEVITGSTNVQKLDMERVLDVIMDAVLA